MYSNEIGGSENNSGATSGFLMRSPTAKKLHWNLGARGRICMLLQSHRKSPGTSSVALKDQK